jgi:hypothetical protein
MSRRVNTNGNRKVIKGEVKQNECHVCKKNGESWRVYNDHNFRDLKGRICCPIFVKKMRENCCYKCNKTGHFADHCAVVVTTITTPAEELKTLVNKSLMREKKVSSETKPVVTIRTANGFASLCDSSDEEDKPPSNVTVRKPAKKVVKDWADYESDDE